MKASKGKPEENGPLNWVLKVLMAAEALILKTMFNYRAGLSVMIKLYFLCFFLSFFLSFSHSFIIKIHLKRSEKGGWG